MKFIKKIAIHTIMPILLLTSLDISYSAEIESSNEYDIKAAFIYNFAKLTEWQKKLPPQNVINLCILGKNHFDVNMSKLEGKQVNGKSIKVMNFTKAENIHHCHIAFIGGTNKLSSELVQAGRTNSILLVGESDSFLESGGTINFEKNNYKIDFTINIEAAKKSNLIFNGQLIMYGKIFKNNE